jgi:hypothetical protein
MTMCGAKYPGQKRLSREYRSDEIAAGEMQWRNVSMESSNKRAADRMFLLVPSSVHRDRVPKGVGKFPPRPPPASFSIDQVLEKARHQGTGLGVSVSLVSSLNC